MLAVADSPLLDLVFLIPALPLAGFLFLLVAGKKLGEPAAGYIATLACAGSFGAAVLVFLGLFSEDVHSRQYTQVLFEWIPSGGFTVDIGFLVDPLSVTMTLFVTGIGSLIHLYSVGYMHGDERYSRFFVYLNLFIFSMTMLVLGNNMLVTFLGWEGVGACSFLLISFWFEKDANAVAGKKAFVTNRVGDWGFMLAMFLTFQTLGTLTYADIMPAAGNIPEVTATAIALLLFVGAIGKSAQLPLYVWLPDAMAGPTPVSALIHAATMVTAGVYLMVRTSAILVTSDIAPDIVAWTGVLTALVAASIAVAQHDIKKVLAYSTISQLGYMFLAVGTGAYVAAIFHMVTHAFFKALLFLGSGSVIHGMNDEQDMRRMGALRKAMPITGATFIIGWLAIAGVPPFAGFWSKDEILAFAWQESPALWFLGLVTALLTAYYMSRQVFLVFFGEARWNERIPTDAEDAEIPEIHPHESPWQMTAPLVVLAGLAIVGGALNLPPHELLFLEQWLDPVFEPIIERGLFPHLESSGATQFILAAISVAAGLVGIAIAYGIYIQKRVDASQVEPEILQRGWYFDESLAKLFGGPGRRASNFVATVVDAKLIDGAVNGVATMVRSAGTAARSTQTGFVRNYAVGIAVGAIVLLVWFFSTANL